MSSSMFTPLGPSSSLGVNNPSDAKHTQVVAQSQIATKAIDDLGIEKDLIDLSRLKLSASKNEKKEKKGENNNEREPEMIKADTEKKQKSMLSTLGQKKKELQEQKEKIDKLNKELQQLDVPVAKEIVLLRGKIEYCEKELSRATKVRKQKETELLAAIDTVSKLADEKASLTERLRELMYDSESVKRRKLKELEEELHKMGM